MAQTQAQLNEKKRFRYDVIHIKPGTRTELKRLCAIWSCTIDKGIRYLLRSAIDHPGVRSITLPESVWTQYRLLGRVCSPRIDGPETVERLLLILSKVPMGQLKDLLLGSRGANDAIPEEEEEG